MAHRKEATTELEGMLGGLKLSEAESSAMKGAWKKKGGGHGGELQAVGKLFSEKPGNAEGIVNAVGNIWCPRRGIRCKDLGDNLFLFTFLQPAGKRRAIEDGPWEFGGDLLIVRDFDESSLLEELEFVLTPMWVRVHRLPIGLMTTETGEEIGDRVGKTIEVDTDEGGSAVGKFLRIKIHFDIRKPLMRGVTMEVGPNGKTQWCPLEYEFLPNFCYICGLLGHVDRECPSGSWKEKKKPFGPELRVWPSRRRGLEEARSRSSRSSGSGGPKSEGNSAIPGRLGWTGGSGSDSERTLKGSVDLGVWNDASHEKIGHEAREEEQCEGVKDNGELAGKDSLLVEERMSSKTNECRNEEENNILKNAQLGDTNTNAQEMEVDTIGLTGPHNQSKEEGNLEKACESSKKQRTVRKVKRANQQVVEAVNHNLVKKRGCEALGEGDQGLKRQKMEVMWRDEEGEVVEVETDLNVENEAGLPEQFRRIK
ncbi:unnamed protein product [Urochloa humidicola]